ncbi:hypothetical protein ACFWIW_36685 [Amycolatopsis sp. NPDC058340]|uniref:hypothetical protein n=1 Tax=Amycolatopsis sp. NPDC058340 TaxID=3346453 RepID=UPI003667364D
MDRLWGILVAAGLVLAASACGGPDENPAPPPPSSSSKPPPSKPATSSTPPTFTPSVSPAKVTAACPFLGADELAEITGGPKAVAQEQPPGKAETAPEYTCAYLPIGQSPDLAPKLYFFAFAKADPRKPVTTLATNCPGPSTPVPGAGDAAMHCDLDDYWTTLAVAKRVHGETRMLNLQVPHYRDYLLAKMAKLLGDRL